jgi:predicted  nucleic acid-binding Zn-ribbon protein
VSISDQIPILEELATLDGEIRAIDEQLDAQRGNLDGMRSEVKSLEEGLSADRESLSSMDKTRSELMIELRQMAAQVDRSREKLQRSRNERESNAAQRELEELRKLVRDREDEVEKLTNLAEQAKQAIATAESKHGEIGKELEGTQEGAAKQINELDAKKQELLGRRGEVSKKLPPVLYRRYENIRGRRPHAIAQCSDGTCNGCHMTLPPMMFQKMLRLDEFDQCPNCHRILYYQKDAPNKDEASSGADQSGAEHSG